jgi:uncharacterized protein (DUF2141 family)
MSFPLRLRPLALVALATLSAVGPVAADGPATIVVNVSGLRNERGQVGCALFSSADAFPSADKALARVLAVIAGKAARCEFKAVAGGTYAVAVMHDENGDGKLNRSFIGVPTEGYGASNDARPGLMRAPRFADARFLVPAGATTTLAVPVHY